LAPSLTDPNAVKAEAVSEDRVFKLLLGCEPGPVAEEQPDLQGSVLLGDGAKRFERWLVWSAANLAGLANCCQPLNLCLTHYSGRVAFGEVGDQLAYALTDLL
jgi:hypothetical protein